MNLDKDELGGNHIANRSFTYTGDAAVASAHMKDALVLLGELKLRLQLGDIWEGTDYKELKNGVKLYARSSFHPNWKTSDNDSIHIDTTGYKDDSMIEIVLGYIIFSRAGFYVQLPDGNQTGLYAKDTPEEGETRGPYTNAPGFEYNGFPDYGGTKSLADRASDLEGAADGLISNEFAHFWNHAVTNTKHSETSTPPAGYTWPEIYHDWINYPSPVDASSGPYYSDNYAGGTMVGYAFHRIDHQGVWFSAPFKWTDGGMMFLFDTETPRYPNEFGIGEDGYENGYDVLYMMPTPSFRIEYSSTVLGYENSYWGYSFTQTSFQQAPDIAHYPEEWLPADEGSSPETNAWHPWKPNPATDPSHHTVITHKWDITETESVEVNPGSCSVPVVVKSGLHQITHKVYAVGSPQDIDYKVLIVTDKRTIRRSVTVDTFTPTSPDPIVSLNIVVGTPGKIEELVY